LLLNFTSEHAIRRVQGNQDGLKLNCTHQLLVYAYDINMLDRSIHNIKKITETLVVPLKETGLGINADKTAYMVTAWNQNAERSQNVKIGHNSFERVQQFKYLRTTLTNQNSILQEIKIGLKSGNVCYHLVQNRLSYSLLSKNVKIIQNYNFDCCFVWV
jgi:hypothetical protein